MEKICFNKDWRFAKSEGAYIYFAGGENKSGEVTVDLPHDFMIEQERSPNSPTRRDGGYFPGGTGYYTKIFTAPESWRGKCVMVEFEGAYMNTTVKLNGSMITRQNYGYTTFYAELDKYLKYGEENILTVTADNSSVPNSRWYSGSGLYRYAWLYVGEPSHIIIDGTFVKTLSADSGAARVSIETNLISTADKLNNYVEYIIRDSTGRIAAGPVRKEIELRCSGAIEEIAIPDVKLWDIETPHLYKLTTNFYEGGELKDTQDTVFGVRTFSVTAENGLVLNGRKLKLKGGCVHHDNGILGSASYARSEERKIELLKQSGFNAVRTAHNPPSPAFLDACDRLGMIVMDEAFDSWRCAKTQFDYHVNFDCNWKHDLVSMVMRDRNHPSVLFWSIGNEIVEQCGGSDAANTSKMLAETIKKIDSSRPVGMAYMGGYNHDDPGVMAEIEKVVEPLDFVGYNYLHHLYEKDIKTYPNRVIIGTETVPKEIYTSWNLTLKHENIIGDFVWTAIDYLGEAGIGRVYYTEERPEIERHLYDYPWNQAYCGDIDVCGFKRPQSFYRDILWGVSDKPKMFARRPSAYSHESERVTFWGWNDGVEGWDFDISEGKELIVDIYSPAETVKLYLNGELLGEQNLTEFKTHFTVPYKKGELKAVDSNNNTVILASSEKPAKIKLTADRTKLAPDGDLVYVTVEITDENGKTVTNAVNEVYFSVEGPGKLIAAGSSNPKTEQSYAKNSHSAYDGRLMAVVKTAGTGEIILNAIADGLKRAEMVFIV